MTTALFDFLAAEWRDADVGAVAGDGSSEQTGRASRERSTSADDTLVSSLRAGDRQVFDLIVDQYAPRLVRFATTYARDVDEAEDVVADIFSAMWEARAQLDVRTSLSSYLFGAVRNKARQRYRNVMRRGAAGERFLAEQGVSPAMGSPVSAPDTTLEDEGTAAAHLDARVHAALDALSERARVALTLRWYEQMDYATIASILGVSPVAVRQTVHRALETLRRTLVG